MEEDLNENELEERFYSMLHYGDNNPADVTIDRKDDNNVFETTQQITIRRYWRTSTDASTVGKVNVVKNNQAVHKHSINENPKTKAEKRNSTPPPSTDLSIFQCSVPKYVKKTIEILENDEGPNVVELESSDEDEVVEVALPPKPTITIDSSDEEVHEISHISQVEITNNNISENKCITNCCEREVSASPVPSIVSSVSDEFIRGDCIALNISSRHPNNQSFDFSLHGSDIIDQNTPNKRKKRKKNKENVTSTPLTRPAPPTNSTPKEGDFFATPKAKARNKKQRTKKLSITQNNTITDVYDSDSNQSVIETDKNLSSYIVTEKSFPSTDVYESDSNQSENISPLKQRPYIPEPEVIATSDSTNTCSDNIKDPQETLKKNNSHTEVQDVPTVDLTETSINNVDIAENVVMANVVGFSAIDDKNEKEVITTPNDLTKFGSTNVPAILYEDLDFDNLKGKEKVCKKRRYSLTTLRAEMEKFYNESWGGENFNHREIQKNMSRDKSLWVIDPKDKMPGLSKRKPTCNYCNRPGHRDDICWLKPPICYMCGSTGHYETRCPRKICVNCGSRNHMYTTMCRNCSSWGKIRCAECGQNGHPASHCPDLWRRYHNTITLDGPLEENRHFKKHYQMFCSGCTRRGHLIHSCRISIPFSSLPINSPYVAVYKPIYAPTIEKDKHENSYQKHRSYSKNTTQDSTISSASTPHRTDRNKRQSNSPVVHETHLNKKRNMSNSDVNIIQNTKDSVMNTSETKISQNKHEIEDVNSFCEEINKTNIPEASKSISMEIEKVPDFIPLDSANHDKQGQIIQDNEVSDTSDILTSARIYITHDIMDRLKTKEGDEWLKTTAHKHSVKLQNTDFNLFISILGKVADQENFQAELRDWIKIKENNENCKLIGDGDKLQETVEDQSLNNIPKHKFTVLRKINKALDSLKEDLGDPEHIYKELVYLQNHHQQLLKQKVVSTKQLLNNRNNINKMLKKLNMLLIGQAGLADGPEHLVELYSLKEKLTNFRQKYITTQMRREIGQHFHCIFTAIPRPDYEDLLNKYNQMKSRPVLKKKKFNKPYMANSANAKNVTLKTFQKKGKSKITEDINAGTENVVSNNILMRKPLLEQTMNKLVFFHRRLMRAKSNDNVLNKTRINIVNKLNSHISYLEQSANNLSANGLKKMRKKMRKTQEEAKLFLINV